MLEGREVNMTDGRKFVVDREGRIYQNPGAVHIPEWQLTPEELKEIVPDRYNQKFGEDVIVCPFSGCETPVLLMDGRSIKSHFYQKHRRWYEVHGDKTKDLLGQDLVKFIRETENRVQ